jgi:hypothetical protein
VIGSVQSGMTTTPFPAPPAASPQADPRRRLAALLARQAGVVSRAQALAVGLAPREVDRYVARRRWVPVHPRVYLAAGRPLTDEARVRAAALWAGDGAVVVGAAASWWHGLGPRAPRTVAVAVPRRCPAARPGVTAHRRVLPLRDVVVVRSLRVPVRPLAVLDAAVAAGADGAALLRRALWTDVGLAQLRAAAGSAAGTATALRLVTSLTARNEAALGIATVNCEHRTLPRGRPGPGSSPGAR